MVRFGIFEADLQTGELRKNGLRIRLQEKPFGLLALLLERPGEVVSREEVRQRLWNGHSAFDFDHSVGNAMTRLRAALGDPAANPRFIETLPRRGFRFVAPVEVVGEAPRIEPDRTDPPAFPEWKSPWAWLAGIALLGIAGYGVWFLAQPDRAPEGLASAPLPVVPLTSYDGMEINPSFSPDGSQIVFSWNGPQQDNFDIYVKLVDSGMPDRLTMDPGDDVGPAWSPDGRQIAFYRRTRDGGAVHSVSSRGGSERKLVDVHPVPQWTYALSWSPDGKLLAFQDAGEIFLLAIDTLEKRKLSIKSKAIFHAGYPAFSPDGETLAFAANWWMTESSPPGIYLVPTAGGSPTQVAQVNEFIHGVAWSADGEAIFFCSGASARNSVLSRVPATGGAVERFMQFGENALGAAISPEGSRLLYVNRTMDTNVWRFDARDDSPARRLIASTRRDGSPSYSPDGRRIVIRSDRSGNWELWSYDSEGSDPVPLTLLEGPFVGFPSWSPDGKEITFDCHLKGNWDICVIKAEGGAPRLVTSHAASDARPAWSRDGHWIYFGSGRTGTGAVWKVPAEGGDPIVVASKGYNPVESPDGRWLYYSKERSIWRIPTGGGDETLVLDDYSRAAWGNWAPLDSGIWFAELADENGVIKFLSFDTGRIERDFQIGHIFGAGRLSVSPDRRWILFNQVDRMDADLMLVENFR